MLNLIQVSVHFLTMHLPKVYCLRFQTYATYTHTISPSRHLPNLCHLNILCLHPLQIVLDNTDSPPYVVLGILHPLIKTASTSNYEIPLRNACTKRLSIRLHEMILRNPSTNHLYGKQTYKEHAPTLAPQAGTPHWDLPLLRAKRHMVCSKPDTCVGCHRWLHRMALSDLGSYGTSALLGCWQHTT